MIDAELCIRGIGPGLARFDRDLAAGARLIDHFDLTQPAGQPSWRLLSAAPNVLFALTHRKTGLDLRGQMIVPEPGGPVVFLGSSWLDDPLQLADFGFAGATTPADGSTPAPAVRRDIERGLLIQLTVARCLAESTGAPEALTCIVRALTDALAWRVGIHWTMRDDGRLDRRFSWPAGAGLPADADAFAARACATGAPLWEGEAVDGGGAFAIPLHDGSRNLGVIACFSARPEAGDGDMPRVFAVVAGQITQFLARQNAAERVRRLASELAAIFQLSPDGFIAFNEAGRRSYINPALLEMIGVDREEIEAIDEAGFEAILARLLDARKPPEAAADDGEIIHLAMPQPRVLRRARRDARDADGRALGRILYFRDITRESEMDRMKTEFLSNAAHELRTPLASIHGFAELMLRREFDAAQRRDIVETIFRQTSRLVELVNALLAIARLEARSDVDTKLVAQALVPVVTAAVGELLVPGDARRVELTLPKSSSPIVALDRDKFVQALINVLANAYKYSPNGGPITLRLRRRGEGDGRQVGVAVRDRGIGMNPEQVARVFERFYRADPSGRIPGTGLGMSLVKQIMDLHGGHAEVESAPGKGTEVTLWLPLAGGGTH